VGDHRLARVATSWLGDHQDEKRDPASTTKMMTAYLVTKLAAKDRMCSRRLLRISERADKTPGSTSRRKAGEKLRSANCFME